ncbi:hypothetical protein DNTS_007928 [Danionella cerebrum]|uniref:BZIP domain-containing protein n=1 Tax=Danionella cerebrum TaxID=2873325 RepID=A0A553PVR2_9TELE|nr:hypothetical protein DNTS_007928 [Danionella translucida]
MPAAVMDSLDRGSPFSPSGSHSHQEWNTQVRKKNKESARKCRKKQTEKADLLHEEFQALEQSNATLVKEISELKKEVQIYTTALERHEPHCTKLNPASSVSAAPSTASPSTSSFIPEQNLLPYGTVLPDINSVSLADLFDWTPWDSVNDCGYLSQI